MARGLAQGVAGRRVARMQLNRADLRTTLPPGLAARIEGQAHRTRRAGAPNIFSSISRAAACSWRISACRDAWCWARTATAPSASTIMSSFTFDDGTVLRFNDARRFGMLDFVAARRARRASAAAPSGARAARQRIQRPGPRRRARRQDDADQGGAARSARRRRARQHLCLREPVLGGRLAAPARRHGRRRARRGAGARHSRRAGPRDRGRRLEPRATMSRPRASSAISSITGRSMARKASHARGCDCGKAIRRIVQSGRSTFYCAKRQR